MNIAPAVVEMLTVRQVAERMNVNLSSPQRWIAAGLLPAVRLGPRCIRVRSDDLANFARPVYGDQVG